MGLKKDYRKKIPCQLLDDQENQEAGSELAQCLPLTLAYVNINPAKLNSPVLGVLRGGEAV